jgi:hypothetical protein
VISPFIFTLYTNDCHAKGEKTQIVKFSDDTAIVDMSDSHAVFETEINSFVQWCSDNHLELNVKKTKEMFVDFKKEQTVVPSLQIREQAVERVDQYRYLGIVIDNRLMFNANVDYIYTKCRQRMYILYQLRALMVNNRILERCYRAFIESILTFSFICWFGCVSVKQKSKLSGIVNVCSKIVGTKQISLTDLFKSRALTKAVQISQDPTHALSMFYELLPSGRRFRAFKCRTKRFQTTFVPTSVTLLNAVR